jgi:uncharacterized protein (DUF1778 family)
MRLAPEAKEKISAAAAVSDRSVSEFVVRSALDRAEETLADQRVFLLDADRWKALTAALDAPPRVLPELRKLLERKAPWE